LNTSILNNNQATIAKDVVKAWQAFSSITNDWPADQLELRFENLAETWISLLAVLLLNHHHHHHRQGFQEAIGTLEVCFTLCVEGFLLL